MNHQEAAQILEISTEATPEDAKKAYRTLTKKYHPDINKEPGAEDKFKKINEAYQVFTSPEPEDQDFGFNPFQGFGGMDFGNATKRHSAQPTTLHAHISFKDSVFGVKHDLKFERQVKCKECNGQGRFKINNGCSKCHGQGQVTSRQGMSVFIQTCDQCRGKTTTEACKPCNSNGTLSADVSLTVTIPAGVQDNNVLRIQGMGNYVGSFGPMDQSTDVHLYVHVAPDNRFSIRNQDITSNLTISLLEAIQGTSKTVETLDGTATINIPPRSRHKEEICIRNLGISRQGNQQVILNVEYPKFTDNLTDLLSKEL